MKHFREALKDFPSDATYASDKYWKLTDYLEVLEMLQGSSFIILQAISHISWSFVSGWRHA
ncbi:hypothetical protein [Riemerella columbipharyngis]|uniref:hypothetical protein n=1 Tax=Riemerella columbipharyngis TaxID=1071918 RepID=UPI0015A00905|nr:hypothetical protein [Riemerella columbipharyngis]